MKKTLTKGLATSAAVLLSMGLSTQVLAGAVAYSYLELDNFRVFNDATDTQLDVSDFSFLDIGDSASASAVTSFGAGAVTASPNTTDTLLACSGNCAGIAENDPTQQATTNFGRGDTDSNGGAVITGLPGGNPDFANVWTVAEGRQEDTGFTTAQSGARNTTEFTFTLDANTNVRFDFDANAELFALLHQDEVQAQASYSWNVTILDIATNTEVFLWAPDGTGSNPGGTIGGTTLSDPFSLNDSRGQLNTGQNGTGLQAGFFSSLVSLAGQTDYRFAIGHASQENTQAIKEVPEPSMLFLLGAGLAGFGLSRYRSKAKA